jgi:peroxiredoxin Q/BCP
MYAAQLGPGDKAPAYTLDAVLPSRDETGALRHEYGVAKIGVPRPRGLALYVFPAVPTPWRPMGSEPPRDVVALFDEVGYDAAGLSPDPVGALMRFSIGRDLNFPLLADPTRQVLTAYGCIGEREAYGRPVTGVMRSVFALSPQGIIEYADYDVHTMAEGLERLRETLARRG